MSRGLGKDRARLQGKCHDQQALTRQALPVGGARKQACLPLPVLALRRPGPEPGVWEPLVSPSLPSGCGATAWDNPAPLSSFHPAPLWSWNTGKVPRMNLSSATRQAV